MMPLQFPKVAQRPRPIIMSTPVKPKDPQPPRTITETKPILKPTVISTTDLVGQILLQGFGSSSNNSELPQTTVRTVPTVVQTESTNRANNVVKFLKDSMKDTKTAGTVISTMTPRAAPSSISWDMNKVLTPRDVEKRQHDVQVE